MTSPQHRMNGTSGSFVSLNTISPCPRHTVPNRFRALLPTLTSSCERCLRISSRLHLARVVTRCTPSHATCVRALTNAVTHEMHIVEAKHSQLEKDRMSFLHISLSRKGFSPNRQFIHLSSFSSSSFSPYPRSLRCQY
jgi:hypothetical protein